MGCGVAMYGWVGFKVFFDLREKVFFLSTMPVGCHIPVGRVYFTMHLDIYYISIYIVKVIYLEKPQCLITCNEESSKLYY